MGCLTSKVGQLFLWIKGASLRLNLWLKFVSRGIKKWGNIRFFNSKIISLH